ncbi:MAG: glycosyltransferase family 39 protein, partial [Planctomycetota bacterium]
MGEVRRRRMQPTDWGCMPRREGQSVWHRNRRELLAAALVFAAALSLRLIYLDSIQEIGFFDQPVSDGLIYFQRAHEIASGDWLGPQDFVHAPLYAYVLGIVELAAGPDLCAMRMVQVVLGAASCVLLLLAVRAFFDFRTAVIAAALLVIYPPALFFDGLIQKTCLALFLSTLLLWLLGRCAYRPRWSGWCACGLTLGLLILTRQNALALVPLLAVWLWVYLRRHSVRQRGLWTSSLALGLTLTLLPWAVRNRLVTGEFVLTTPNLGQNLAMGNHPQATGTYLPFKRGRSTAEHEQQEWIDAAEQAARRPLSAGEVSDYYRDAALQYIRAHPGAWLRLMFKKWLMVWNAYEAFDTEDYYLYQEWSGLLRSLDRVLHFGFLAPLAAAGIVLTWSRRRDLWILYAWLLISAAAVAVFVVFARYRFVLVPVLVMFAAAAVVNAAGLLHRRRLRALLVPAVVLLLAGVLSNITLYRQHRPYAISYTNHGAALAAQGRYQDDLAEINKALALKPGNVDAHLAAGNTLV